MGHLIFNNFFMYHMMVKKIMSLVIAEYVNIFTMEKREKCKKKDKNGCHNSK